MLQKHAPPDAVISVKTWLRVQPDKKECRMTRLSAFAFIGLALWFGLAPFPAAAGIGAHLQAAMEHTQEVIDDGAKGDARQMVVHVASALGHAREALHKEAAEMDRAANKLLHRAIRHLRLAEMRARFGDAARAAKHAADALTEMKKIK